MLAFGAELARHLRAGDRMYLSGELGAGKTTLVRGVLRGLGHQGAVKSPTFTLVEPYDLAGLTLYHFDLYRINSTSELVSLGLEDYFTAHAVCLIEWPERGAGVLPEPDIALTLSPDNHGRSLNLNAKTARGEEIRRAMADWRPQSLN
ncbi:MAG: tRNA (adenosine(37)-N6)-threonylcarbamoyltransferase complex ATPase subunit type 1 TsaE [Gammaproteobacteria bacterium]|nr:MAG: tRNA (adenosine(37)-N6)-threonylcarbamoyltransferase complex ATPase subunit type 1 TsaE [Gammaproteobacteria bacterium]